MLIADQLFFYLLYCGIAYAQFENQQAFNYNTKQDLEANRVKIDSSER